jgi:hypothetical protein
MKKDTLTFVTKCDIYQRHKGETFKTPGALQPLPIPSSIWTDISMYFIMGLPKAGNKLVIMVVVDCLSNYAHFCALPHRFTPSLVAQVFIDHIFKLHDMPTSIVSNCDLKFTNTFLAGIVQIRGNTIEHEHNIQPSNIWSKRSGQ